MVQQAALIGSTELLGGFAWHLNFCWNNAHGIHIHSFIRHSESSTRSPQPTNNQWILCEKSPPENKDLIECRNLPDWLSFGKQVWASSVVYCWVRKEQFYCVFRLFFGTRRLGPLPNEHAPFEPLSSALKRVSDPQSHRAMSYLRLNYRLSNAYHGIQFT